MDVVQTSNNRVIAAMWSLLLRAAIVQSFGFPIATKVTQPILANYIGLFLQPYCRNLKQYKSTKIFIENSSLKQKLVSTHA